MLVFWVVLFCFSFGLLNSCGQRIILDLPLCPRGGRAVVEPHSRAYSRIVYHFGPEILLENGEIDRQKLGQLIFASEEKRRLLNSITHPEIHKAMLKEILFYFLKGERLQRKEKKNNKKIKDININIFKRTNCICISVGIQVCVLVCC